MVQAGKTLLNIIIMVKTMVINRNAFKASIHSNNFGTKKENSEEFVKNITVEHAVIMKQLLKLGIRWTMLKQQLNHKLVIYACIILKKSCAQNVMLILEPDRIKKDTCAKNFVKNGWLHVMISGLIQMLTHKQRFQYVINNQTMNTAFTLKIIFQTLLLSVMPWGTKLLLWKRILMILKNVMMDSHIRLDRLASSIDQFFNIKETSKALLMKKLLINHLMKIKNGSWTRLKQATNGGAHGMESKNHQIFTM